MWRGLRERLRPSVLVRAEPRTNSLVLPVESEADSMRMIELVRRLDQGPARPR